MLEQEQLSRSIEEDERYESYINKRYKDDGDEPGLLTQCINAGLLGKSSRRGKDTLAKKLFIHDIRGDKEMAIKFVGAGIALADPVRPSFFRFWNIQCGSQAATAADK